MKILVVDDQPDVVAGILDGVNWRALHVEKAYSALSAAEAKDLLLREKIDILLLRYRDAWRKRSKPCCMAAKAGPGNQVHFPHSSRGFSLCSKSTATGSGGLSLTACKL